jgi:hypothetical protein
MARWTLFCPHCHFPFVHSLIEVKAIEDYFLPVKPDLVAEGANLKCSVCGYLGLYYRCDLTYQA